MMTLCFHVMEGMGRIRDDGHVLSSSPGGGTEAEVCFRSQTSPFFTTSCFTWNLIMYEWM